MRTKRFEPRSSQFFFDYAGIRDPHGWLCSQVGWRFSRQSPREVTLRHGCLSRPVFCFSQVVIFSSTAVSIVSLLVAHSSIVPSFAG